jgi:hypothetical protein
LVRILSAIAMFHLEREELGRFLNWLFLLIFFVLTPPLVLFVAAALADLLADPKQPIKLLSDFRRDLPLFLLTFYSGTTGGVIAYVYGRQQLRLRSDQMVTKTAKLLSAGLMGVAVFLLLRSAVFIKLFYPNVALPAPLDLDYQPTLVASLVAGLAGPVIVRRLQARVRRD